jgi:hypothetical protein
MMRREPRIDGRHDPMTDLEVLDRTFHLIITQMVETGRAPHYAELAPRLGCSVETAHQALRDVIATEYPGTLYPGTDQIVWFPPLSSLPTQYRISVDGQQRWFAQCGFESVATSWLFPGSIVRVDAPCLDCGEAVRLEMRDGAILAVDSDTVVGHLNAPWKLGKEDLPFT